MRIKLRYEINQLSQNIIYPLSHIKNISIVSYEVMIIYTIILLKSVGVRKRQVAILARSSREMSQLFVSTDSTSCHEFASQFGLAFFVYARNIHKLSRKPTLAHLAVEWTSGAGNNAVTVEWPATLRRRINCGNAEPDRLTKNSKNQPVETTTMRVYTFTACTMWFRNYHVTYAFVVHV